MLSPSTMALRTVARVATALGIRVSSDLFDRWRGWFAPHLQPFSTTRLGVDAEGIGRPEAPTLDIRDTFHVYSDEGWTWLEEAEFVALSLRTRRALLHGRAATGRLRDLHDAARAIVEHHRSDSRIVWWPSVLRRVGNRPLVDYVENKLPPSRHRELTAATWARADRLLPRAVELAGTFPAASGPNCFGNVLAAAGVVEAAAWCGREPFEEWLDAHTRPVRGTTNDHLPGVVLVWRDHEGLAEHVSVTIGDGYVFNKPSQGWFSPRLVWTVQETIAASRYPGVTLSRYVMTTRPTSRAPKQDAVTRSPRVAR